MSVGIFEYLPLVTTPLALVAFLAATVVLMHVRTVGRAERLIRAAPAGDRATLVAGALDILDVKTNDLTKEKRFELALEILEQRRHRNMLVFWISMVVATALTALAAYAMLQPNAERDVDKILAIEYRNQVMPILRDRGIFEASDKGVIEYLAHKTALTADQRQAMTDEQADLALEERYESVGSIKEMRRRARFRMEPFTDIGERVTATVPDRIDHPRQFFVHVPMNSRFADRPIKVTSLNSGRYIRTFARGSIDPDGTQAKIHLNKEQAAYLAGAYPKPGRLEVIVRETVEPIYDPNCSSEGRTKGHLPIAIELCSQGESVSLAYLQGILAR